MSVPGPIRFRRIASLTNAAANAFLSALLPPTTPTTTTTNTTSALPPVAFPRARLLYVRDMPKDGSRLSLDFASLLGPLFYSWLCQARKLPETRKLCCARIGTAACCGVVARSAGAGCWLGRWWWGVGDDGWGGGGPRLPKSAGGTKSKRWNVARSASCDAATGAEALRHCSALSILRPRRCSSL